MENNVKISNGTSSVRIKFSSIEQLLDILSKFPKKAIATITVWEEVDFRNNLDVLMLAETWKKQGRESEGYFLEGLEPEPIILTLGLESIALTYAGYEILYGSNRQEYAIVNKLEYWSLPNGN